MINNSINTSEVTKSPTAAVRHRRMRAVALGVYLLADVDGLVRRHPAMLPSKEFNTATCNSKILATITHIVEAVHAPGEVVILQSYIYNETHAAKRQPSNTS